MIICNSIYCCFFLCLGRALSRLDDRIHELHKESDDANVDFKELHKQRVQLKKEKESRQADIDALMKKCNDLQMLKFGRIMDLDELEAGADHSKEEEAEATIREIESKSQSQQQKSVKEVDKLKEELSKVRNFSVFFFFLISKCFFFWCLDYNEKHGAAQGSCRSH